MHAANGGDLLLGSRANRQNSKSSHYKYTPLQTPQSIRLLQLSRGERDDPLQCHLFEVRLDDWPLYEAVSYTWGDPSDKSVLDCNSKTISVPRNLVEGLRMLRRTDRLRILWADAVCINQKDMEERGSQVGLMARIFSEASRVLVWLGHGDSAMIRRAFSYICWYLNREKNCSIAGYSWDKKKVSVDDSEESTFKIPADDVTMEALSYLSGCPYFGRGWIVQELVLPRSVRVYYDEACINFRFIENYFEDSISSDAEKISDPRYRKGDYRIGWIQALRLRLHDTPGSITFTGMLMLTRHQNFSDPRDYVYGLLGLERLCRDMRFQRPLFKPDYTVSWIKCYKSLVETFLIDRSDIGILTLVRQSGTVLDDLPSWVPRLWHSTRIEAGLNRHYYRIKPAESFEPAVSRQQYGGYDCMRIRGFRVSKLKAVIAEKRQDAKGMQTLMKVLANSHGECRVACTMTYGSSLDGARVWGRPQAELKHVKAYREFLLLDTEETKQPYESLEKNVEGKVYYSHVSTIFKGYALFETEDDQLGISHSYIEPGDQVVIFLGGRMPFVLRPVGDKWRLIGVCYIHEIMDGGPVKQMKHDPRYMAEDFNII